MKTYSVLFLIAVITYCNIEVDSFSFNFSGGFNPGITFGKSHNHPRKYQLRNNKYEESNRSPEHVINYDVPEYVSKPIVSGTGSEYNEKPQTRNYESQHRNHRH